MPGEPATPDQKTETTPAHKHSLNDATSALKHSLNDAEILANYAVRNNVTGVQEAISGIATAREIFASANLNGDNQREFYENYSALASKIWPVSVASLKDSLEEYGVEVRGWFGFGRKYKLSRAGIVGRRQSILATLVLIVLVVAQSYWLIGNTFILAAPPPTAAEIEARRRAESDLKAGKPDLTQTPVSAEEQKARDEKATAAGTLLEQSNRQDIHREEITRMLASWAWYFPMHIEKSDKEAGADRVFTICGRILDVLQQYVLPLLYGLLGAMAFVIRTISQQARDRLYRVENETGYYLRIWLGILGGLAIGWFFKPSSEGVGSISPLALAFVAGYSVDLLFTAMDRIVNAFSAPDTSPEKKQQPVEPAMSKK